MSDQPVGEDATCETQQPQERTSMHTAKFAPAIPAVEGPHN